jgi:hypothetical protein
MKYSIYEIIIIFIICIIGLIFLVNLVNFLVYNISRNEILPEFLSNSFKKNYILIFFILLTFLYLLIKFTELYGYLDLNMENLNIEKSDINNNPEIFISFIIFYAFLGLCILFGTIYIFKFDSDSNSEHFKYLYKLLIFGFSIYILNILFYTFRYTFTNTTDLYQHNNYFNMAFNCFVITYLILVLFLKSKIDPDNYIIKLIIFTIICILTIFLQDTIVYTIKNIYPNSLKSKEYKNKLIQINNKLNLGNSSNSQTHNIDKNAIIFFDTINDFDKSSSNIITNFNIKHNIDEDQYKKLYSQNEYKFYFQKVYDTLQTKYDTESEVNKEYIVEFHNFLITDLSDNYSNFYNIYKDSDNNSNMANYIQSNFSDDKFEIQLPISVFEKEIIKNYKYVNGQESETKIIQIKHDNNYSSMLLIGFDTENLIMDYDYFIENVPAKYYGAAYLNYFTLENGGINKQKFITKYYPQHKDQDIIDEKINEISSIFIDIDGSINKNIKLNKYIIGLIILIITGIIIIFNIFNIIKTYNIIKNPEFYSLIIIILFIIAFILGEVIFSRI